MVQQSTYINKFRIGVLGDSMSVQNSAWYPSWPKILESALIENGVECEVRSFCVNAHTYYRALTAKAYGDRTSLEALIDYQPDVILVPLGVNDVVDPADSRTLAQAKTDAAEVFRRLRSYSLDADIYYLSQQPFDDENFTGATLKNKGTPPKLMHLRTTGILDGLIGSAMLEDDLDSAQRTEFTNYEALDTYISGLSQVDGVVNMRSWKICRLGTMVSDRYHFNNVGEHLLACAVYTGLVSLGGRLVTNVVDQLISGWNNIETILDGFLTDSGDGFTPTWPTGEAGNATYNSLGSNLAMNSWFHEYKAKSDFYPLALTNDSTITGQYNWFVRGAKPHTTVENAIDGVFGFTTTGITTDERGNAETTGLIGPLGLSNGSQDFYLKVDNDVFGPFTIVLSAP